MFICVIDLLVSITFMMSCFITFWLKLDEENWKDKGFLFIPIEIWVFILFFYVRFFLDIMYLVLFCEERYINRSSITGSLYWFRIKFEMVIVIAVVWYYWDDLVKINSDEDEKTVF